MSTGCDHQRSGGALGILHPRGPVAPARLGVGCRTAMGARQGAGWFPSRIDDLQHPIWLGVARMSSEGKVLFYSAHV